MRAELHVLDEVRDALLYGQFTSYRDIESHFSAYAKSIGATDFGYAVGINDTVAHSIDTAMFFPGDLISVDSWFKLPSGLWVDGAVSEVYLMTQNYKAQTLVSAGHWALRQVVSRGLMSGTPTSFIGYTIEMYIDYFNKKLSRSDREVKIIKTLSGHGIGEELHMDPRILNYGVDSKDILRTGDRIAIEPLLCYNNEDFDHKTWKTLDGELSSHIEGTFEITETGVRYLYGPSL